jgi:hypothetical protein
MEILINAVFLVGGFLVAKLARRKSFALGRKDIVQGACQHCKFPQAGSLGLHKQSLPPQANKQYFSKRHGVLLQKLAIFC